jgi:hypothetical protein
LGFTRARVGPYFELPYESVLICHILVFIVATLPSVQVENMEPVLEVAKFRL